MHQIAESVIGDLRKNDLKARLIVRGLAQAPLAVICDRAGWRYFGGSLGALGAAAGAGAFGAALPDEVEAASHWQASARRERIFETLPRLNTASFGASWLSYIRTKTLLLSASARMKGIGVGSTAR